jgi:hypothetical protein
MLTNWKTISNSIKRLKSLEEQLSGDTTGLTKKEAPLIFLLPFSQLQAPPNFRHAEALQACWEKEGRKRRQIHH